MADDDSAEGAPVTKGRGKKKLLFAAIGLVVLIGAGLGAAFAFGFFGGDHGADADLTADGHGPAATDAHGNAGHGDEHADAASGGAPVFVDLPQLLVNLAVGDGRPRFLKLSVAVEVQDAAVSERIAQLSPRIVDSFQMYLRTLTPAELQTPGAMFRLKEDLHVRIQQAIEPMQVADVLFKEMLVQ